MRLDCGKIRYTLEGTATIYVKDVWTLIEKDSLILRQAKAMHPELRWIVIAGSPCQDLTYAGFLNGLLGLTGQRSMLFFIVYIVILHLQKLYGIKSVRYITENAGSMQPVHQITESEMLNASSNLNISNSFYIALVSLAINLRIFFSVLRLCGSRQVVAHYCAD